MTKLKAKHSFLVILLAASESLAMPWGLPRSLSDQNMKINFEVHVPWKIMTGKAHTISGSLLLKEQNQPGNLNADVSVQKLEYKAGLRPAGQVIAAWLEANPPTPARFVISKSTLSCTPETISAQTPCKGSLDGQLTIWQKDYFIDVPIEMKKNNAGFILEGFKIIKFGEYGFGDPNSTIANLKPNIELTFSV